MRYIYQCIYITKQFIFDLVSIIKEYKRIFCISIASFFLLFSSILTYQTHYQRIQSSTQKAEQVILKWNQKDIEWLSDNFHVPEEQITINTGFKQDSINQVFYDVVYNSQGTIKKVDIYHEGKQVKAKIRIMIETYDSMKLMKTLLSNIVNDTSKITYNYNENDFMNKHAEKLKKDLKDFPRDYMDVQFLLMTLNPKTNQWEMDFEENKEFFNSMSGNMFAYMEKMKDEGL